MLVVQKPPMGVGLNPMGHASTGTPRGCAISGGFRMKKPRLNDTNYTGERPFFSVVSQVKFSRDFGKDMSPWKKALLRALEKGK